MTGGRLTSEYWLSPVLKFSWSNDWLLDGRWQVIYWLENSCVMPIWLVASDWWPWPVPPGWWPVCFLSIGQMAGGWLTGGQLTGDRWVYTHLVTSTLRVATFMGLPPGSRAMWGSVPIFFFFSSDESDMACKFFFFLDMTLFLEA